MKTTTLLFGLIAATSANIIFTHVPLGCNDTDPRIYKGCLRGQDCIDEVCVPVETIRYSFRGIAAEVSARDSPVYSTDGTCGPAHGNTICDPKSKVYTGGCCSQYGWCGNTDAHCGTGCISGCTTSGSSSPVTSPTAPRADGRCGAAYGGATCDLNGPYGGCCSQYGYCGATPAHCLASNNCQSGCSGGDSTSSTLPQPTQTSSFRADGRCGSAFDGATCDANGPYGGCCSQYGYCGSTPGHCLASNGCQNGCTGGQPSSPPPQPTNPPPQPTNPPPQPSTTAEPVIGSKSTTMEPGAAATGEVTTDGTCGAGNGNTVCGNWPLGNCCSMYGFCGNTSAHCGAGCQSGNCMSAPEVPAPGPSPAPAAPNGGYFAIVGQSGVPAMHAGLMPNGRVFFLDKLENYTQLRTPDGYYAMSSEYDPETNTVVPLTYETNAFCSGGTFLPDGSVISVGGNAPLLWLDPNIGDGFTAIRHLTRSATDDSANGAGWLESADNKLASARWYATAQTMPDGSVFVASGSLNGLDPTVLSNNNPTYEILNSDGTTRGVNTQMDILVKNQPYYMYPFVHLLNDGTLFVFVSKSGQIFNVGTNTIVKELPDLPGDYRTYPNTGGSVLLPLSSENNWTPDIVICGGGAYQDITSPTDPSCGRIQPMSANANWEMESMPEGRGMVEGTLLPDGTVIWLNGGNRGAQGFGLMADPTLKALLYEPTKPLGQRFSTLASSTIPRLYHSVALLLLDGTLMVSGSNPVQMPMLEPDANDPYVTEFRVENYIPPYLQGENANRRPTNIFLADKTISANGEQFMVTFNAPANAQHVQVVLYHGGFVTHSLHMGHRMLNLDSTNWQAGGADQTLFVTGPPNHNVAPPGPYVIYVLVDGVPGIGQFMQVV